MYLFLINILLLFFYKCNGCFPTEGGGAPEIPLCATCGDLPVLASPGGGGTMDQPGGSVATGMTGPCKSYTVTCPAAGTSAVIIGANQAANSLSTFEEGEKTAMLVCNDSGQIEGRTVPAGDSIIVTDVYCSRN